jgi:hypothetical protein
MEDRATSPAGAWQAQAILIYLNAIGHFFVYKCV